MLKVYDGSHSSGRTAAQKPRSAQPQGLQTDAALDMPRDQILIEDLVLDASIGVFDHEYETKQALRFDVTVDIAPLGQSDDHEIDNVVRYDHIIADIKALLTRGHVDLVETLAEDIAALCLAYGRAEQVTVTVAKLEAFEEAGAVGVRITRRG